MTTDAEKLAQVMVELALLKKTKEQQKRDLKIAKASKAATKDTEMLLAGTRKSIASLKKRRDVVVARLVRVSESKK